MQAGARTGLVTGVKQNLPLVILVGIYWAVALLEPWELLGAASEAAYYLQGTVWLAFVLIHGSRRYGWDKLLILLGITVLVSWAIETASIAVGFPFGGYHYTELLGARAGSVPWAVLAAYAVAGYLAWTMGTVFLGNLGSGIEGRNLVLVPAIASLIMVMWDLCMDPIKSTIEGAWVWEGGGAHHGVPISNYFGWYLTMFIIYQLFALYLYRVSANERVVQTRTYWILVPVMFLGLALEFLFHPFVQTAHLEIYWSSFVLCILTMVLASVFNIIRVNRMDDRHFAGHR
ncbi:MAG: carotenoid biosynthesis protein [Anaerolineae bacterium]|nr:carotenoid biosynthesis protein [Anaerolineae bacterium]